MRSDQLETELNKRFIPLQMISFAFISTIVFVGALPYIGIINVSQSKANNSSVLVFVFIGIALVVTAFFIKSFLFKPKITKSLASDINVVMGSYFVATLIQLVLFEAAATLGLVAYVLSSSTTASMVLTPLAVLGVVLNLPKKERVKDLLAYSL